MKSSSQSLKFYEAWHYLDSHEYFKDKKRGLPWFLSSLCIDIVKVNPENSRIEEDKSKNTKVEVWLECGPPYVYTKDDDYVQWDVKQEGQIEPTHDPELDCSGDTFEDAIINLASLVNQLHG